MSFKAFYSGANVIINVKGGKFKAMTCAWATMISYESVGLLMGEQSDTAKSLRPGDIVGISSLASGQKNIALAFGEKHSLSFDKSHLAELEVLDSAYVIKGAKTQMKGEVVDIIHLPTAEADYFVIVNLLSKKEDANKKFMSYSEIEE